MRMFIVGPTNGFYQFNVGNFKDTVKVLKELGVNERDCVFPYTVDKFLAGYGSGLDRPHYKVDIPELLKCDGLFLLDGWRSSAYSSLMSTIAHRVGIRVWDRLSVDSVITAVRRGSLSAKTDFLMGDRSHAW